MQQHPDPATPDSAACARLLLEAMPGVMRAMHGLMRQRRSAEDEPLSMGQLRMLAMLRERPWTMSDLASRYHVAPSTMSRAIDALVRRDWVVRTNDPSDRRQVILTLTETGNAVHSATLEEAQEALAAAVSQLSDAERARLYEGLLVLRRLSAHLPEGCEPDKSRQ